MRLSQKMVGSKLVMWVFYLLRLKDLKLLTEKKIFLNFNKENMLPHKKFKLFTQDAHIFKKYFYMESQLKISVFQ